MIGYIDILADTFDLNVAYTGAVLDLLRGVAERPAEESRALVVGAIMLLENLRSMQGEQRDRLRENLLQPLSEDGLAALKQRLVERDGSEGRPAREIPKVPRPEKKDDAANE